ncbi:hypothetical protein [Burkholderia gladioli]|uniref:hypothetical protein n=1 Tax=Burkholderia gladioli TaxID=28095 RepID=UPI001641A3C1|nr:hypothetical protein [Burkholderia gladioli]
MANANFTEGSDYATQAILGAIQVLHDIWTVQDDALGNKTEAHACSLSVELLPIIGVKLDAALEALGIGRSGCFDDILLRHGLTIAGPAASQEGAQNE